MQEALMVDKITSWKFVEEFADETPAMATPVPKNG
jgi:hypothetical protein